MLIYELIYAWCIPIPAPRSKFTGREESDEKAGREIRFWKSPTACFENHPNTKIDCEHFFWSRLNVNASFFKLLSWRSSKFRILVSIVERTGRAELVVFSLVHQYECNEIRFTQLKWMGWTWYSSTPFTKVWYHWILHGHQLQLSLKWCYNQFFTSQFILHGVVWL